MEQSIASLSRQGWWSDADNDSVQRRLWTESHRFFEGRDHLRIDFAETTADPAGTIDRVIRYLQIEPDPARVAAAVKFIRPDKRAG